MNRSSLSKTMHTYRPEIDGLRALAVVPVILFHTGVAAFAGGFIGVDVFFVISGYLITSIMLRESEKNTFSLLHFYERRARRILPALFTVVGISFIPAVALLFPGDLHGFGKSAVATALFGSNILFWRESGYFDTANELKPLLHTWSLAVEEQYYVIFPIVFLLLWRFGLRRRSLFAVFVAVAAVGLLLADWGSSRYRAASFFLLPTRTWELLVGAALAMVLANWQPSRGRLSEVGGVIGVGLLLAGMLTMNATYYWPGRWALLPVVGTALVILYARPWTYVGRALAWKPMVGIGLVSYSAYLWHQPLFAFARLVSPTGHPGIVVMAVLTGVTFLLAWLSWRYVEQPFRNSATIPTKKVAWVAGAGTAAMLISGLAVQSGGGLPNRFSPEVQQLIAVGEEDGRGRDGCMETPDMPEQGCRFTKSDSSDSDARVLLWGDSHAMALSEALAHGLGQEGIRLEAVLSSGCPPVLGLERTDRDCIEINDETMSYVESGYSPDVVIVHAYWAQYAQGSFLGDPEQLLETQIPFGLLDADRSIIRLPQERDTVIRLLENTMRRLNDIGKTVVVIGSVPEATLPLPSYMARRAIIGLETNVAAHADIAKKRREPAENLFEKLQSEGMLTLLRPSDVLCDNGSNICTLHIGYSPLYRDGNHLSRFGSAMLAETFTQNIADLVRPITN